MSHATDMDGVAEATLLAALLVSEAARGEVFARVEPGDFMQRDAGELYERFREAWQKGVRLDGPDMRKLWALDYKHLAQGVDRGRAWQECLRTVTDTAVRRKVRSAVGDLATLLDAPDTTPRELRQRLDHIVTAAMDERMWEAPPALRDHLAAYDQRLQDLESGTLVPVPFGMSGLDQRLQMYPGEMVVLAARPRVGKTAFALSAARQQLRSGMGVGFICFEMGAADVLGRLVAQEADLPFSAIRKGLGGASADTVLAHNAARRRMDAWPLELECGRTLGFGDIRRICLAWVRERGVKVIYIDYLTRIRVREGRDRWRAIAELSNDLKSLAQELNIPLVVLAQIGRGGANTVPRLEHIRECGDVEQDADAVLILDRPDVDEPSPAPRPYTERQRSQETGEYESVPAVMTGRAAAIVAKQRNGATGLRLLDFHASTMRYHDDQPELPPTAPDPQPTMEF